MIEILILHTLSKGVYTMYGIKKHIEDNYSAFLTPSLGTIRPALMRLVQKGFISFQKNMSKGGRPSVYYSITNTGKKGLTEYLLSPVSDNPVQFLSNARIRLSCSDLLDEADLKELIKLLKIKAESTYTETSKLVERKDRGFCSKMVLDNLSCEYKNFISLLEGLLRAGNH